MSDDRHQEEMKTQKRLEELRKKLKASGVGRGAASRRQVEKAQRKTIGDRRELRVTGRDQLFNFRCRLGLHEECKRAAEKREIKLCQWMEEHLEAALVAERDDAKSKSNGASR